MSDFITEIIFGSGAFGTHRATVLSNAVKLSNKSCGAKAGKLAWLVFLPYDLMCLKYPVLKKHPYLLPVMWCVRWIKAIFYKQDKIAVNFEELSSLDVKDIKEYKQALEYVGLKFN